MHAAARRHSHCRQVQHGQDLELRGVAAVPAVDRSASEVMAPDGQMVREAETGADDRRLADMALAWKTRTYDPATVISAAASTSACGRVAAVPC
jgi:hypothetical protein